MKKLQADKVESNLVVKQLNSKPGLDNLNILK
jgi:hypothetical protein